MRDFNKIPAKFWMTSLSKQLKQSGPEVMLLSIYLQTNHHTHSLGIFYLPISYIAHDIGISLKKVKSLVQVLIDLNFCSYDFVKEYIWLKGYALEQAGGVLKQGDNRVTQLQKYFEELPYLEFTDEFYQVHKNDFHLTKNACESNLKINDKDSASLISTPLEAPSDTLQSTETKTETKTESETETKSTQGSKS